MILERAVRNFMTLLQSVKDVCDRIAPLGWRDLLLRVTSNQLDIRQPSANALQSALLADLTNIDRNFPGFVDFSTDGHQAITPAAPGLSLFYHALASPGVAVGVKGPLTDFPTLREIEVVENFVFGVQPPSLAQLRQRAGLAGSRKLSIVLFAYEYRPAGATCSGFHADLTFSRTGISRVGTSDAQYAAEHRGFQSEVPEDPFAFSVCPAKFGAFLAVRRSGSAKDFGPMRPQKGDKARDFWVPIHKLFGGPECLKDLNLSLRFNAFHYNDKIRRIQIFLKQQPPATEPFQFTNNIAEFLDPAVFCQGLLCPVVHPRLVEPAVLDGRFVTFRVPPSQSAFAALEPGAQTLNGAEVRPAPAYVHARTQVRSGRLIDLNSDPSHPDVRAAVRKGNYDALHYLDFTGDGKVDVEISGLTNKSEVDPVSLQAYSLIAAPDFFPSAGQRELTEWTQSPQVPATLRNKIWGVDPVPLCDTRLPANLQMPNNKFDQEETTITAIVPLLGAPLQGASRPPHLNAQRHSCLPDDAAGVFAPGWDVSTDKTKRGGHMVQHLAAYGLGSPFPEDSKLCAALSTFWATVAPDITRGMSISPGNQDLRHTVAPLTDEEIGQIGSLPWDGNPGPRVISIGSQQFAECASFFHVDYVRSALDRRFTSRLTARVTSEEYERRVLAMAFTYAVLGGNQNRWFVLSFRSLLAGDTELQKAQIDASTVLPGTVYRFDVFQADESTEKPSVSDFRRRLLPIFDRSFLMVDPRNRIVLQRRDEQPVWSRAVLTI
jgi:hypothetical protein